MQPTVSVVIPNYNYAKTLRLCLKSVFDQEYPLHEVIVADDNSTDASREIAAEFPCTVLHLNPNGGVSAARNAAVAASSGDILFFLDSDETIAPDAVEEAVRLLTEDPGLGCVHGVFAPEPLIDDGPVEWYRTLHAHHWRTKALGETSTVIFVATAMPRRVFDEVGGFDTTLRDAEDVEYSERLSVKYRILLTDRIVARHDEESRMGRMLSESFRRSQFLVPFGAAHRRKEGALRVNTTGGVAMAMLTLVTLPLVAAGPWWALAPLAALTGFVFSDPGLLGVVRRHRGSTFLPFFLLCHLLVNMTIGLGALWGVVRMVFTDFGTPTARRRPEPASLGGETG
ncbi:MULTISPECIES: glycosyltransferase family 2 protein [unclassified Streptomyces]|uniref:glycosyltransferase family 2 protein n=1 Tax=unclassified Streptomyces TaxID=2593676 RepID=UPI002E14C00A|nr:glycosyltransferase [Streptomyces sp. NBC_01197]WSS52186.1 glycosyltransferase [Streptomyces sp. NBC_01180]